METWMWLAGLGIVALAFLLMAVFQRGNLADSRGRRVSTGWRAPRVRPVQAPLSPDAAPGTGGEEEVPLDERGPAAH